MSLEDSPSLEEFQQGIPDRLPDPNRRRRNVRVVLAVFATLAVAVLILNFLNSDSGALLAGTGAVTGTAVDEAGQPVAATVMVEGTDLQTFADASGRFELRNIPAGDQVVVIAFMFSGREYPMTIARGSMIDLGRVTVPTTPRGEGYPGPRLEWR